MTESPVALLKRLRLALPEVDRRRGKAMLRPWSSAALCSWLFALPAVRCSTKRGRITEVQTPEFSTVLDPLRPRTWGLTGDHYRTLETIKPLEPVINDSSRGPADLAQ